MDVYLCKIERSKAKIALIQLKNESSLPFFLLLLLNTKLEVNGRKYLEVKSSVLNPNLEFLVLSVKV
jgi:hypothetical protein